MLYLRHMSLASSLSFKEVHVYLLLCKWVLSCPNHLLILHGFPNDLWEIEVRLILIFFWLWQILLAVRDLSYPSKVLEAAWQWLSSRMPPCVFCLFVSNSVKYFLYGHTVSLSLMSAFFFFFFSGQDEWCVWFEEDAFKAWFSFVSHIPGLQRVQILFS